MKKIPLRMCISCRTMKQKKELLRVVKSPEGVISADETFKSPGRGAYLCANTNCINKAAKTKALSRAFGMAVPDDLYKQLHESVIATQAQETS